MTLSFSPLWIRYSDPTISQILTTFLVCAAITFVPQLMPVWMGSA